MNILFFNHYLFYFPLKHTFRVLSGIFSPLGVRGGFLPLLLTICILLTCSACTDNTNDEEPNLRILLVYIGRDNNLSGQDEDKLDYIMRGWDGNNGKLLVFQDTKQEKPCLMEVYHQNGHNQTRIISEYDNDNSADSQLFRQVITETIQSYPALSYGLIVFSHASGWLPEGTLVSPRSIIEDQKKEMELIDFANAIPDGLFNFIIFEACFMAGIEVAYELKDKTDYILASSTELISPGFTPIYQSSINLLFREKPGLAQFAQDAFTWIDNQKGLNRSGTISLIKTSGLTPLSDFIKTTRWSSESVDIGTVQHFDRYSYHLFFDFEDYFLKKTDDENMASRLSELIRNCVIYQASTPYFMLKFGFPIKQHSGLTTYIKQEQFPFLNQEYQKLKWYKEVIE